MPNPAHPPPVYIYLFDVDQRETSVNPMRTSSRLVNVEITRLSHAQRAPYGPKTAHTLYYIYTYTYTGVSWLSSLDACRDNSSTPPPRKTGSHRWLAPSAQIVFQSSCTSPRACTRTYIYYTHIYIHYPAAVDEERGAGIHVYIYTRAIPFAAK